MYRLDLLVQCPGADSFTTAASQTMSRPLYVIEEPCGAASYGEDVDLTITSTATIRPRSTRYIQRLRVKDVRLQPLACTTA